MKIALTQDDREQVENVLDALEEEGVMIEDITMEIAEPKRQSVRGDRSLVQIDLRGWIERGDGSQ